MKLTITWRCMACGEPVTPHTGYVHLDDAEMRRYRSQLDAWEREFMVKVPTDEGGREFMGGPMLGLDEFLEMPDQAAWKVHHKACDPDPDDYGFYHFPVPRTWPDLLHWTAHLLGTKGWLEQTDWAEFIENALTANGRPS